MSTRFWLHSAADPASCYGFGHCDYRHPLVVRLPGEEVQPKLSHHGILRRTVLRWQRCVNDGQEHRYSDEGGTVDLVLNCSFLLGGSDTGYEHVIPQCCRSDQEVRRGQHEFHCVVYRQRNWSVSAL